MIDVDQVHQLEARIERLLQMLAELREQKAALAGELETAIAGAADTARELKASEQGREAAERKVAELEGQLSQLHTNQAELAEPLSRMLQQLDEFDGGEPDAAQEAAAEEQAAPAAADESDAADEPAAADQPAAPEAPAEEAEPAEEGEAAEEAEAAEPEAAEPAAADEAEEADGSAEPAAASADEPAAEADGGEQSPQQRPGPELDIF